MIKNLKKIFAVLLILFLSSSLFSDENAASDYDDIFANQKIEKDDEEYMKIFAQTIKQKTRRFFYKIKESCSNVFDKFISLFKKRRGW